MKRFAVLTLSATISVTLAPFTGCSPSDGAAVPLRSAAPRPAASVAGEADAVNRYSVSTTDRAISLTELDGLRKKLAIVQDQVLAVAMEDQAAYPGYASADLKQQGLIRLMATQSLPTLMGGGAFYSFVSRTHDYGQGSDIELSSSKFSVGFAGADFGFFASLGDVPLENVSLGDAGVRFAADYVTPTAVAREVIDGEYRRFTDPAGVTANGFGYKSAINALNGMTYVLRSISYERSDILVAFQVVRREDSDSSMIVIWKLLKAYPIPTIAR